MSVTVLLTNIQTHGHHQMEQEVTAKKLVMIHGKFILNQDLSGIIRGTITN